ncbi:hypothetical protein HX858_06835 [Marine Group I thaumarchaeote]|uniref:Uncharacterized protein n=1 Tax=Marine Group I thaumarchaeote TaxID=2511932 RepID=A0A7K4MVA2_9ARCH|nr:MAG: hypothetical protein DSN69_06130 [Nitrosopumilus sp. YT1]NWJ57449.1 hypothetical protein [Marine Group I thaumarchaeote]
MFGYGHNKDNQRAIEGHTEDNDEVIESKIMACQRENGHCMVTTSRRLRQKYSDEEVSRVLNRLKKRRQRGNKYQEKGIDQIMNILENFTTKKVNQEQLSL